MLVELKSTNFGSVSNAEIEFSKNFTVLTGETGVGKTMLLNSLVNLLGKKTSTSVIQSGTQFASSEGTFDNVEGIKQKLSELDLIDDSDSENASITIRKKIFKDSRPSKIFINDVSVRNKTLQTIAEDLIRIHGQSDQLKLKSKTKQLQLLDDIAGNSARLKEYKNLYKRLHDIENKISETEEKAKKRNEEIDYIKQVVERIEKVNPKPGEDEELRKEIKKSDSYATLTEHIQDVINSLNGISNRYNSGAYGSGNSFGSSGYGSGAYGSNHSGSQYGVGNSVSDSLLSADKSLAKAANIDEDLEPVYKKLSELIIRFQEFDSDIQSYISKIEFNPNLRESLNKRLSEINGLVRVFGGTLDNVLKQYEKYKNELDVYENFDSVIQGLRDEYSATKKETIKSAEEISSRRHEVAKKCNEEINKELANLSMKTTKFRIDVQTREEDDFNETGIDDIAFQISFYGNGDYVDIENTASGGELSRIMLAVELVSNKFTANGGAQDSPVLLFDEIDSGIGGETAIKLGERLYELSKNAQIVVITHLPQIAVYADKHILIEKENNDTSVREIKGEERIKEIARMLSGTYTDISMKHARELLKNTNPAFD